MTEFTNTKIFEREIVCQNCGKPLPDGDESAAGECPGEGDCAIAGFDFKDYRTFLPGAESQRDIHGWRLASLGAVVDIEQRFVNHSPTGFEWGYGGSGPADLALNILALFVAPPEAWRLHMEFKWHVVARLPRDGFTLPAEAVRRWLRDRWALEGAQAAASA